MIADLFSQLQPLEQHFVSRVLALCPRLVVRAREMRGAADFEPSSLLVVERGVVTVVSKSRAGRRMVVLTAASGDLLAAPSCEQCLLVLEDACLIIVGSEARCSLLGRQKVAEAIVDELLERLRDREESLAQFGSATHLERVRRKLLQLARRHGTPVAGDVRLELPLTHGLIGEMVGSARETVSGAVQTLEREGFLARTNGRYRLIAPAPAASPPKKV